MTVSKAQTVAGTTIAIASGSPTTFDAAGYAALSYSVIGEVLDLGSFGKDFTLVTHNPLGDRKTLKFRGSYNQGSLQVKLAKATVANVDAGQAAVQTALGSDASVSIKVTFQDGSKSYFTAKVMSFMTSVGSVNSILGGEVKLEIDSDVVESAT